MVKRTGIQETVLYYGAGDAAHRAKLKGVLVRMGIRIKNVSPDQVTKTVGELLGDQPLGQETDLEPEREIGQLPLIDEEVLVMHQFSGARIDELLLQLRKAGVPRIALKAVVTETNRGWSFYHLYEEIRKEHELMSGKKREG